MLAASLGYGLGVGAVGLLGVDLGLISWLVGVAAALALMVATWRWDLDKFLIITATAFGGAGSIILTFMFGPEGAADARMFINPVQATLALSFWWFFAFLLLAAAGILVQVSTTAEIVLEPSPNRI